MTWPTVTLESLAAPFKGSITDGPFGSNLARHHYRDSGPQVVRLQNIGDGEFVHSPAHIDEEHFHFLRKHEVLAGDLLVASLGESLPRACLAPPDLGPAIVKADCIRVRLDPAVDPRWVNYSLQRPSVRRWAERHRHGMGRPRLGLQGIRQIPVPFPPLNEQLRLIEIIEGHLSHIDNGRTELLRAGARLDSLTEAALRQLLPGATPLRRFGELLEVPLANGRSVPSREGGFPVLRLTALKDREVDLTERKEGAWARADALRYLVAQGDFLIARGNGSLHLVGRGSLVQQDPDEVAFPDTAIRARAAETKILPEFLDLVWNSRETRDQIERVARTSAGIYKVNQSQVEAIRLRTPEIPEQQRIVAAMSEVRDRRDEARHTIDVVNRRSDALRRAVLSAAFQGLLTMSSDPESIEKLADRHNSPPKLED